MMMRWKPMAVVSMALAACAAAANPPRLVPVAAPGMPAAQIPGATVNRAMRGQTNRTGEVFMEYFWYGAPSGSSFAYGSIGDLRLTQPWGYNYPDEDDIYEIAPVDPIFGEGNRALSRLWLDGFGVDNTNDNAVLFGTLPDLDRVIRAGTPSEGASRPWAYLTANASHVMNASGQYAVAASVNPYGPISAIAVGDDNTAPRVIVEPGDEDPWTPGFLHDRASNIIGIADDGSIVYSSRLSAISDPATYRYGLYVYRDGQTEMIARNDLPIPPTPGLAAGSVFGYMGVKQWIGRDGTIVFFSFADEGGLGDEVPALWRRDPQSGAVTCLAHAKQVLPGAPNSPMLFLHTAMIAPDGDIYFIGGYQYNPAEGVYTNTDERIWRYSRGEITLLLRENTRPNPAENVRIDFNNMRISPITAEGDLLVRCLLRGPAINTSNDYGIVVIRRDGEMILLAQEGQPVEIRPGDTRTLVEIYPYGEIYDLRSNVVDRPTLLSDTGLAVFTALVSGYTNISYGVFAVQVPPLCSRATPCPADFDRSGGVDGDDIGAFFTSWQQGEACSDVDRSGGTDGDDIGAFFAAWQSGC